MRPKMRVALLAVLMLMPALAGPAAAQTAELDGTLWKTEKYRGALTPSDCKKAPSSIISFKRCAEGSNEICGTIASLNPGDSHYSPAELTGLVDKKNPNPDMRKRKIIGLQTIKLTRRKGNLLIGSGYSPCRGEAGTICIAWNEGATTMQQWACKAGSSCNAFFTCAKEKYKWQKVDQIPGGWPAQSPAQ